MMRLFAVVLFFLPSVIASAQMPAPASVRSELMKINREMIAAERRGDRAFFERWLAEGYIETDEDGKVTSRAEVLKQVRPAPKQVKSSYDLPEFQVRLYGATAVISILSEFRYEFGGHKRTHQYRTTEVWTKRNARWLMAASQITILPKEPQVASLDPNLYDSYTGNYDIGNGLQVAITRQGSKLMLQVTGEKMKSELLPENETTFFTKGESGRTIFVKDAAGQVIDCMYRSRDGEETHAKRIK